MKAQPKSTPDTADRVREAVAAAEDRKAIDLKVLHLEKVSDFTDYFLICSGGSERQVQAAPRKDPGEDVARSRDTLSCGAANGYRKGIFHASPSLYAAM